MNLLRAALFLAVGLGSAASASADIPPGGVLTCQGGGGMRMISSAQTAVVIVFAPAAQSADAAPPGPGECAWGEGRPFDPRREPRALLLNPNQPNSQLLFDAMRGGTFQVSVQPVAKAWAVQAILNVQVVDTTPLSPGPTDAGDAGGGGGTTTDAGDALPAQQADDSCGGPGATATVVIPEPNLTQLNVRTKPGGQVLGRVQEGEQVTVVGPCGAEAAAGFAKRNKAIAGEAGWCQIDAPIAGCVLSRYLDFSSGGDAVGDAPAAGFAKRKRP